MPCISLLEHWCLLFYLASVFFIDACLFGSTVYKLDIQQMNVKIVFLNNDLDEEIYMERPEGYQCKLIKIKF